MQSGRPNGDTIGTILGIVSVVLSAIVAAVVLSPRRYQEPKSQESETHKPEPHKINIGIPLAPIGIALAPLGNS